MKQIKIERQGIMIDEFINEVTYLRLYPECVENPYFRLARVKMLLQIIFRGLPSDSDLRNKWTDLFDEAESEINQMFENRKSPSTGVRECVYGLLKYTRNKEKELTSIRDENIIEYIKSTAIFNISRKCIKYHISKEVERFMHEIIFRACS